MGIDPNNHHVSQRVPLHQPQSSGNVTLFGGPVNHERMECQQLNSGIQNDRLSDAESCLEDSAYMLPDLNLDLTKSIPSPPTAAMERRQESEGLKASSELGNATKPTLLLFT